MSIAENIAAVRANIARACAACGRRTEEITLLGASKMNDAAACREAIAAGIDALGENRVQEMQEKLAQNAYDGAPLHFIGHLQRNKVKAVVGRVALIESVSSLELLGDVERIAARMDLTQDVLLEVNIGAEESKSGFSPEEVRAAAEFAEKCGHIRLRGLMCIPPVSAETGDAFPYFEKMHTLFVDIGANLYHNRLDTLSMGMSSDYEEAIRAGATLVRVGTGIFGRRPYPTAQA